MTANHQYQALRRLAGADDIAEAGGDGRTPALVSAFESRA